MIKKKQMYEYIIIQYIQTYSEEDNNPFLTSLPPAASLSLYFPLEPIFLKKKFTVDIGTSLSASFQFIQV